MKWILILLVLSGCSSDIDPLEPKPFEPLAFNRFIEDLHIGPQKDDQIITASVTTSDSCGNFSRAIIVQDATGAMELRFSFYDSYALFQEGDLVSVKLNGRTLAIENGILYANMGTFAMVSKTILRQGSEQQVVPRPLDISDIKPNDVGLLVEVGPGEFAKGGTNSWSGEQKFSVGKESITVYTSPYASYASKILPHGTAILTGIVTMYGDKFQLKLSSDKNFKSL